MEKSRQVRRAELRRKAFAYYRSVFGDAPRGMVRIAAAKAAKKAYKAETA